MDISKKKKAIVIIILMLIIITSKEIETRYFAPRKEIKIVSYNIHSGLNKDMFPTLLDIIDFLRISNADIICLQEVNESAKELKKYNVLTFAMGLDRIDYIFTSPEIEMLEYNVLIKTMSDHYPIVAKIKI